MATLPNPILVIEFGGWILIRLATDPDPPDEPRGISGYSFAFGNEPDLDRVLRFTVPKDQKAFFPRSHAPRIGVTVSKAIRIDGEKTATLAALEGAVVNLLDEPKLENRNWTLTPAGFEPIVPFKLEIKKARGIRLFRSAPLDPDAPDKPLWEMPASTLQAQGAVGLAYEPVTVGNATGIWDSLRAAEDRLQKLTKDLQSGKPTAAQKVILKARIKELEIGIANAKSDRRINARYAVERFNFAMKGKDAAVKGDKKTLGGVIDTTTPWQIGFWIGGWDPDALSAYISGALKIPYAADHVA
jgi:hypothetical protein